MSFYETLDKITADAGIRVRAQSLEELFCKALLATFNEITDIQKVPPKEEKHLQASSELPYLLADLINLALVFHDAEGFVASKCEPVEVGQSFATVKLYGDYYDPQKHEPKLVIKAATYHDLYVKKEGDLWVAQVIFDI